MVRIKGRILKEKEVETDKHRQGSEIWKPALHRPGVSRVGWSLGGAALEVRQEEVFQLGLWLLPGLSTFLKPPDTSRPGKNTCGEKGKSWSSDQAGPD